jgi:hypothetical protein
VGNNGNGAKGNICSDCQSKLTPVKLYAPEILRMFTEGRREYSRNNILVSYSICISPHCKTGHANLMSYQKVVDDGMIKVE